MIEMKLLVVEDNADELESCIRAVNLYNQSEQPRIRVEPVTDVDRAIRVLNNTFDGALIDLRIGNNLDAGNEIIAKIEENEFCIPVIVLTGTPARATTDHTHIDLVSKGDPGSTYPELLMRFRSLYRTGVTKILGGRGEIQSRLGEVFRKHISNQIEQWEVYAEDNQSNTERALLRHILYHLVPLIDEHSQLSFAEECYLCPSPSQQIRTGTILEDKAKHTRCVVMSPDCDLIVRNGSRNTNRILVVEVVHPKKLFKWYNKTNFTTMSNNRKGQLRNALNNRHSLYYHCLPESHNAPLGFLDFRKLKSLPDRYVDVKSRHTEFVQISPPFVKDIVSRFAAYYARQGQPDVDFGNFLPE